MNDYDEDGNCIVPCPICDKIHCPSNSGEDKCPEEAEFIKCLIERGWTDTNIKENQTDEKGNYIDYDLEERLKENLKTY